MHTQVSYDEIDYSTPPITQIKQIMQLKYFIEADSTQEKQLNQQFINSDTQQTVQAITLLKSKCKELRKEKNC